jgi:hypothetical protein
VVMDSGLSLRSPRNDELKMKSEPKEETIHGV